LLFTPTLDNFIKIFQEPLDFWPKIVNTVIVVLVTVVISTPLAAMGAYAFSRYRFRGRNILFVVVLATQFVPAVVILMPYFTMFRRLGLYDTLFALIVVYVASAVPYGIWMIKGFMDALPREVEEAALVDGCNELGVLRHVTIPLSAPGVMITVTMTVIARWNEFLWAFILTKRDALTVMIGVYNTVTMKGIVWGQLSAGSMLVMIPVFLLSLRIRNYFIQGLTMGAVK
jgi:multiple sugar transport system permease protein